jgi:putative transposase
MYIWRKMTQNERDEVMAVRRQRRFPKHSPPHFDFSGERQYLISAACYEHIRIIGKTNDRMTECEADVLETCQQFSIEIYPWCILPNHYHILLKTERIKELRKGLGLFHGRSSYRWNGEDNCRGRQVWHNCFERAMKSERHFWASLNYVNHNSVHHGYVEHWQDWPWSGAKDFIEKIGREKTLEIWTNYPILDYGKKWDID